MNSAEPETADSGDSLDEAALSALDPGPDDAEVDPLLLALMGPLVDRFGVVDVLDALSQLSELGAQAYPVDAEFWADASMRIGALADELADEGEEGAQS